MTAGPASAPALSSPSKLPRAFGRYVLFDLIGRGGMADIYLARMGHSLGGHRLCVIKQVRDTFDDDPAFMEMLTAEAKLAARLNHANIVQVFDLGREEGRLFLAMDYVEGFDLHQLLKRLSQSRIPLPAEFAFSIVIETLRALDYAHRARDEQGEPLGIVHRDVSPSNVLISFEGEVKLCDFGIARAVGEHGDEAAVQRARVAGKAAYMSPEHARGEMLDARADIFAAGILLWELSAGRRLYRGKGDDVLELAKAAEIPPVPERGIPNTAGLQQILDRALAPRVEDRFTNAADFLEALEEFAIEQRLRASPLRFGAFMSDHFAGEIVEVRRERERAAEQVVTESFGPASAPPPATVGQEPILPPAAAIPDVAQAFGDDDISEVEHIEQLDDFDEVQDARDVDEEKSLIPPAGASQELALGSLPPEPPAKPAPETPAPETAFGAPQVSGSFSAPPKKVPTNALTAAPPAKTAKTADAVFFGGLFVAALILAAAAYYVVSSLL